MVAPPHELKRGHEIMGGLERLAIDAPGPIAPTKAELASRSFPKGCRRDQGPLCGQSGGDGFVMSRTHSFRAFVFEARRKSLAFAANRLI